VLAIVPSATLHGLDGRMIRVEVDVAPGLPGFTIATFNAPLSRLSGTT